ncbi:Archaemetzincin-2-like protein [Cladobotryum mycophilum]|uniref:Archaemetzincin-2-like protein n=1 Tax=Cladobotryum mycophilum TaxID=491253 RepID=A0ABR0SB15_9HYPO
MSSSKISHSADEACRHSQVYLDVSPHARVAKFKRPSEKQRVAAASGNDQGKEWGLLTSRERFGDAMTFPGPLILPEDDLAEDPEFPPQDFAEWRDEEERNPVTSARKTIYVVPSPKIEAEVSKMKLWGPGASKKNHEVVEPPNLEDVVHYLAAFFHGIKVKVLDKTFSWQVWDEPTGTTKRRATTPAKPYDATPLKDPDEERLIGLKTPKQQLFGIRCRPSPDGVSAMQVNLDDVLDALMGSIPRDAHSVVILLDQDMYEGDGDIFTAGRAYGGSRIAAVSHFRDHPLHAPPGGGGHAWPLSHCAAYVDFLCAKSLPKGVKRSKALPTARGVGPLHAAVEAAATTVGPRSSSSSSVIVPPGSLNAQWLGRTVQTMAHELCHCLGMDHCVYFACVMQGSGNSEEAVRQPPYLCPVCLEKLAAGIGGGSSEVGTPPRPRA